MNSGRRIDLILAALLVAYALCLSTPVRAQPVMETIAVLGLESRDQGTAESQATTASLARALTESLRQEAAQHGNRYEVAAGSQRDLSELKLLSSCFDERKDCMLQIGRDLGAQHLVYGRVEKQRSGYTVALRHLDVSRGVLVKQVKDQVSFEDASEQHVRQLAPGMFRELLAIPSDTVLQVAANVGVGTVLVDGQVAGELSGGQARLVLAPGRHTVTVRSDGYRSWEGTVQLAEGQTEKLEVGLVPGAAIALTPPAETVDRPGGAYRVMTWTSAALTAGGVVAFTVTGLKVRSLEEDKAEAIAAAMGDATIPGGGIFGPDACADAESKDHEPVVDICKDGKTYATLTNVFIGVTAGLAVATGVFAYKGYVSPGDGGGEHVARTPRFRLLPQVTASGFGVGASLTF